MWHTGETVQRLLDERGISHAQFSMDIGISSAGLYNHRKRNKWNANYGYRAAKALGVNAQWLQTGEGEKFPVGRPVQRQERPR